MAATFQLFRSSSKLIDIATRIDNQSNKKDVKDAEDATDAKDLKVVKAPLELEEINPFIDTASTVSPLIKAKFDKFNALYVCFNSISVILLTVFGFLNYFNSTTAFSSMNVQFTQLFIVASGIFLDTICFYFKHRGRVTKLLTVATTLTTFITITVLVFQSPMAPTPRTNDIIVFLLVLVGALLATANFHLQKIILKKNVPDDKDEIKLLALIWMLRPYFWPKATSVSAFRNRLRAIMTWVFVIASKVCNVISPLLLGKASTLLIEGDYQGAITNTSLFCLLVFLGKFFKECQSLIYLRVAQAAFVELSERTFSHLHELSLDWHLKKKVSLVSVFARLVAIPYTKSLSARRRHAEHGQGYLGIRHSHEVHVPLANPSDLRVPHCLPHFCNQVRLHSPGCHPLLLRVHVLSPHRNPHPLAEAVQESCQHPRQQMARHCYGFINKLRNGQVFRGRKGTPLLAAHLSTATFYSNPHTSLTA